MLTTILQAVAMFAVTNIDDIVVVAVFFGRARGNGRAERNIVVGQYLGFGGILAVSLAATAGLSVLSDDALAYLGLFPLALGIRAGVGTWKARGAPEDDGAPRSARLGIGAIAGVTFANGGDNIGVYVPVFTGVSLADLVTYVVVFLALVAVLCLAGRHLANRPLIARALDRWGHIVLPVVLVAIGVIILVEGGAFGL